MKDGTPTDRALRVLDLLASHGPLTLTQLTDLTETPRSAIHRACQTLEKNHWITPRLWDHAYVLHSRLNLHAQKEGEKTVETLRHHMKISHKKGFHADLAFLNPKGIIQLIDSTDKTQDIPQEIPPVFDPISMAIQIPLPPVVLTRLLAKYVETANYEERQEIQTGNHMKKLKNHRQKDMVQDGKDSASIAIPLSANTFYALRLRPHSPKARLKNALIDQIVTIKSAFAL